MPSAAIKRAGSQAGVWMIREGRAEFRPVMTGVGTLDGFTQVRSGLKEGERVIVHSSRPLAAEDRVSVAERLVRGSS